MKKKIGLIILIQVIVVLGFGIFIAKKDRTSVDVSMDAWQSQVTSYDEEKNEWYIDQNTGTSVDTSEDEGTIYGPNIDLKKGSYTISVEYETDTAGNRCTFSANEKTGRTSGLRYSDVTLNSAQKSVDIDMEAIENVKKFEMKVQYVGSGYLRISNIEMKENANRDMRHMCYLVLFFLLADGGFLFRKKIKEHQSEIALIIGISFLASVPMMMLNFYNGHDLPYHTLRIEGIAQELKLGNFPARMHSFSCSGYGHPVSIYYGDLLLYIPAVLRLLGFSVLAVYKIYVYLINLATATITYLCLKKMFQKNFVAMAGAAAYTLGAYRVVDMYVRASVGEFTAMMVFPVIALAMYEIYTSDEKDWKTYRKSAGYMILGMTGLITSHILSTEMVALFLALVAIVLVKKTIRKNTLKVWGMSILGTILVNAWFLVPFADYYMNVDAWINHRLDDDVLKIQDQGAYIGQYFAFLQSPRGLSEEEICSRLQLTPGIIFMAVLLGALYLFFIGKRNKKCMFYTGFSLFSLFMASDLFPWDWMAEHVWGVQFLASVQFPWRYIAIAVIFLMMLLCELLLWIQEEYKINEKIWSGRIIAISMLMMCILASQLFDTGTGDSTIDGGKVDDFCAASLNTEFVGDEYLRMDSYTSWIDGQYQTSNIEELNVISRKGETIRLQCKTGETEGSVEVPVFHYPGYHVRDDKGKEYKITDGNNNVIRFTLPAKFDGTITITYEESIGWRLAEILSLVTVAGIIVVKVRKKRMVKIGKNKL